MTHAGTAGYGWCEPAPAAAAAASSRLLLQDGQGLIEQAVVRRGDHAAVGVRCERPPIPVAYDSAGAFDHRNQCHEVERLERCLDDEIAMAGRQQAILIAVAAESSEHGFLAQ